MTTDYKSRVTRKQKKPLPGYVWLLSGLAIGLFVAFIVYLDKQPENYQDFGSAVQAELEKIKKQAKNQTSTTASTEKAPATDQPAAEKKQDKFKFYTLLPELEILIPESEIRPPGAVSKKTSIRSQSNTKPLYSANKQYILQVGSFQNISDAERLKANLAFLGLEAGIQHVTINSQAWHRVRTGPYQNKQQLFKKQKLLRRNGINYIAMELR